MRTLSVI